MINKSYFDEIIVIGSGKIASDSVSILLKKFNKRITIIEYEVALFSPFTKFKKYDNINIIKVSKEKELSNYFNEINNITLIVSANNNYLFQKELIKKENIFIINFHNSLLPKHRGRNAQMWTIFSGDEYAGITWHVVNSNIDNGDILIQNKINIDHEITSLQLTKLLINCGIKMFDDIIPSILENKIKTIKQKNIVYDIHTSNDLPNNGYLNLSQDINAISLFLRSMDFGKVRIVPYPKVKLFGESFDIISYSIKEFMLELKFSNNKILKIEIK